MASQNLGESLQDLHSQEWRIHDGDMTLSGRELAKRLVERGFRHLVGPTVDELLGTAVGEAINTGVSSWRRVR